MFKFSSITDPGLPDDEDLIALNTLNLSPLYFYTQKFIAFTFSEN